MKKFNYFIYDILDIESDKKIEIKSFEYNSTTLVLDFYNTLVNEYVVKNCERVDDFESVSQMIEYYIPCLVKDKIINEKTFDLFFDELINNEDNHVYCIIPDLPVGGVVAEYRNYKIVIHSNENNHLHFPHVHVYDQIKQNSYVSLIDYEIKGDLSLKDKAGKKIMKYIKKNTEKLTALYNDVVSGKVVDKVVIDIIE